MTNPQQPTPSNSPTEEQKVIIKAYQQSLKSRGFCLLDSSASNQTQLYNYFNGATLPFSFLGNDFSKWLLSNGKKCSFRTPSYLAYPLPHIVGSKFIPDEGKFYTEPQSGIQYANTYQRYKPTSTSKEVSPLFLDFFERIAPCQSERHLLLQWLAHIFQRPSERPSWHIMMPSDPGCGKGFLVEMILTPVLLHTSVVNSYAKVMGQFSTVMADNLLVLLDDPKSKSDDTQIKLKSLLSEARAYCERKGLQGGMVYTFTRFILASNELRPLHLESNERRWLALTRLVHRHSPAETQAFIKELADWLALPGSLDAVYNWFMDYSLEGFNPKHVPQSTSLKEMIGMSVNPDLEFIRAFASENTVFRSIDLMQKFKDEMMTPPGSRQLPHLLREIGYETTFPYIEKKRIRLTHPIGMSLEAIRAAYKAPTL